VRKLRKSDKRNNQFTRSDRLIIDDRGFYYRTRENISNGPFATEAQALHELNVFLSVIRLENELYDTHSAIKY
jgi:hypothetical protein